MIPHPPATGGPSDVELAFDDRWTLVLRITSSHQFAKAAHLRDLLLYLAKQAILAPGTEVTEQEIGWRVLGRRQDYNPQTDNIVRVQIRRLRQKIDEYFATEGQQEQTILSIPKGSHVLRFESRIEPLATVETPVATPERRLRWLSMRQVVIGALLAVAFFLGTSLSSRTAVPVLSPNEFASSPVWTRIFSSEQPTSVVIADSSVVIIQNILQKSFTLDEYIDRSYRKQLDLVPDQALRESLKMIAGRQYTSLADATLASELTSVGAKLGATARVRYARHMNIRDFNGGNYIFIGSSHSIPWVSLFEPALNFQFEKIGKEQRFGFRNKHPLQGEPAVYGSGSSGEGLHENYATISLVPNLSHNGSVLMLNGVTMEATEAAGEYSISREFTSTLEKLLGKRAGGKLPFFEILIKARSVDGAPHHVELVSWRKLDL
jgi:hypothetical protein